MSHKLQATNDGYSNSIPPESTNTPVLLCFCANQRFVGNAHTSVAGISVLDRDSDGHARLGVLGRHGLLQQEQTNIIFGHLDRSVVSFTLRLAMDLFTPRVDL